MKTSAIYAGSFDPITLGHINVIRKALTLFDAVTVSVGINPKKTGLFSPVERVALIKKSLDETLPDDLHRLMVTHYHGGLAEHARERGATHIVRGLRQISDFNDEFTLNGVLQRIAPDVPVVHLICEEQFLHVSSSTARELAKLKADISWLVSPVVEQALRDTS